MSNKPDTGKRRIMVRVPLQIVRKVKKVYWHVDDKDENVMFVRALEDLTRNIQLDAADWQAIADEARKNENANKSGKLR